MRPWLVVIAFGLLTPVSAVSATATGETLAQKEYWENQMIYTQRALESYAENCGGTLEFAYDRPGWWAVRDDIAARSASPNGRCEDIVNALIDICRGGSSAAEVVTANVKRVECGFGGIDRGFHLELKDGRLRYDVELNRQNVQSEILEWLKGQM